MRKKNNPVRLFMLFLTGSILFFNSGRVFPQEAELLKLVRAGDSLSVKKMIAYGTDVNVQDDMMGYTPLALAINQRQPGMVRILLEGGANINHPDKIYGYTPLMTSLSQNYSDIARMLIDYGADIHLRGNNGATALLIAAMNSREMTELLLAKGADIHARSDNGSGVITNCVMGIISGRVEMDLAEYLFENGAEADEKNTTSYYKGYTPLFWAVEDNNGKLVSLLIRHGADVNTRAKEDRTPLSLARKKGFTEIEKILTGAGAK